MRGAFLRLERKIDAAINMRFIRPLRFEFQRLRLNLIHPVVFKGWHRMSLRCLGSMKAGVRLRLKVDVQIAE
jgi:hypothetical protein